MSITGYSDVERDRGDSRPGGACLPSTLGPAERRHPFDPSYSSRRCVCGRPRLDAIHTSKEAAMTVPLYEQSDFASPDETIRERRARLHPLPAKRDIVGFVCMGIGGALSFLLAVFVAYGLAAIG